MPKLRGLWLCARSTQEVVLNTIASIDDAAVGTGEPRHRAQTTRTPWNTERGHHGGDGELDTHTRERESFTV